MGAPEGARRGVLVTAPFPSSFSLRGAEWQAPWPRTRGKKELQRSVLDSASQGAHGLHRDGARFLPAAVARRTASGAGEQGTDRSTLGLVMPNDQLP